MKVIVKVGGEVVGVLMNPSSREVEDFKKSMKEVYPGEVVTTKIIKEARAPTSKNKK